MLNRLIEKGSKKCHNYWPANPGERLNCAEAGLTVTNESVVPGQHYNLTTLALTNTEVQLIEMILKFYIISHVFLLPN